MMAARSSEERAFLSFRESGSPEALVALLLVHQDRIYNLCWQVLHHHQDAEDAAQEALAAAADGAKKLVDAHAFRRWLHRVCLFSALDVARKRARRVGHESRAAMEMPGPPEPLDPESRLALLNGLTRLPDAERSLLIEHYFEGMSLAGLAERDGCSAVAVWKRIEKARENLKHVLVGAGLVVVAANVAKGLESVTPVRAPAGLLGEALIGKCIAGGIAVGTKSGMSTGIVIGVAIALLSIGVGGGYLAGKHQRVIKSEADSAAKGIRPGKQGAANGTQASLTSRPPEKGLDERPADAGNPIGAAPRNALESALGQFRKWHAEWKGEDFDKQSQAAWNEHLDKLYVQGAELRKLVLGDVEGFLSFARVSENENCLRALLHAALVTRYKQENGFWNIVPQSMESLPARLSEGLLELLAQGSSEQKVAVMSTTSWLSAQPEEYLNEYRKLLTNGSVNVQLAATDALAISSRGKLTENDRLIFQHNAEFSQDVLLRGASYKAVASHGSPESVEWLFGQLQSKGDVLTTSLVTDAIKERVNLHMRRLTPSLEAKAGQAIVGALRRGTDESAFEDLVWIGMYMSPETAGPILELMTTTAPSDPLRRAAGRVAECFRNGERNHLILYREFLAAKKGP